MSDNNDAVREALARRVAELEDREQELAAHVERYQQLVSIAWKEGFDAEYASDIYNSHAVTIANSEEGEHSSSLPRLKAQWQAEAFESLHAAAAGYISISRGALIDEARRLRHQAGETIQ